MKFKKGRSFAWMVATLGFAVLLAACFGGNADAFVATTVPTPEPTYEPAGVQGDNPFFSVDEQVGATNSALIDVALGEAEANGTDPTSAIALVGLTSPSDEELASGLYGGSLENTCDPERLITHLLDNPTQGQVWADVQGISFLEIPEFIRSLTPAVLESDVTVLNHGYDRKGHAIPIVSTLAAGTAVLLDADGDVRVRCYCGNPILPYDENDYEPPQCLTFFAVVYTTPEDRERIDGVPRAVRATNRLGNYDNIEWKEVTWGGQTGWVRADESETRYCKPPDKLDCVAYAQITQQPGSDNYIGEINDGYASVVIANVDGWSLVKFAETSGWIPTNAMGKGTCDTTVACVSASSGTWTRPGFAGSQFLSAGRTHKVQYTGQSFIDGSGTYDQVFVTSPAPARVGYLKTSDIVVQPEQDCQVSVLCSLFDIDVPVYQESTGTSTWGVLWFAQIEVLDNPVNGRYQIDWGNSTGWVDAVYLRGYNGELCTRSICIQAYGQGFGPLPDNNGNVALPAGPFRADFTGRVHTVSGSTYREFTSPAVAGYVWIETSVGYASRGWDACEVDPPCNAEVEVCRPRCAASHSDEKWKVSVVWTPSSDQLDVAIAWPVPLIGAGINGPETTPVMDMATGSPALAGPIQVTWLDPSTGRSGVLECEVDLCDFLEYDGDLGYLDELERPDPESCIRVTCTTERFVGDDGVVQDRVEVTWSPAVEFDIINFAWPSGYTSLTRNDQLPSQRHTQPAQSGGTVNITWFAENGQSGSLDCELFNVCDVDDIVFVEAQSERCCPDGTPRIPGTICEPICDGVVPPPPGTCCAEPVALNDDDCCPTAGTEDDRPCGPPQEPELETPTPTPTTPPTPTPRTEPTTPPSPTPRTEPPTPPTPTPRTEPTTPPTPTPTVPACPNGTASNGECFRICGIGELNLDGLCRCASGTVLSASVVEGCVVSCPAGQRPDGGTTCVPIEVECREGQLNVDGRCVNLDPTLTPTPTPTAIVEPVGCVSPYFEEGPSLCFWSGGVMSEPITPAGCPVTGGPTPEVRNVEAPAGDGVQVSCSYRRP